VDIEMTTAVDEALQPLAPHWNRYVRRPLSPREITQLEHDVGKPMPHALRDYLGAVGLFQDAIRTENGAMQFFERAEDFQLATESLELSNDDSIDPFPFGRDNGENTWCLDARHLEGTTVYVHDNDTVKYSQAGDFLAHLRSFALQATCRESKEPLITDKEWCVQFSIPSADIGAVLAASCRVYDAATEWTDHSISPRDVKSSNLRLLNNGEPKILKKVE